MALAALLFLLLLICYNTDMTKSSKIRVRFAPSPTGFLHIGSLRMILLNYLFAKKEKGIFILRIEDTDQERFVKGAVESLLKTLKILKIDFDEGPYYQSKRLKIYQKYADQLVKEGKAYYCYCTEERLEKMRQEQIAQKQAPMYDQHCRNITAPQKGLHTIRLKVPKGETIKFKDLLHGKIEFNSDLIDDQILIKSDGFPTYHFASTIDDHLMEISHVIRGEEWLPSTPKHILLYRYFNWEPPVFIHPSLIMGKDGGKLSKRKGDVAVEDFLQKGYLPEALINFIGLLILSVPDGANEILNIKELIAIFDWNKVHRNPAVLNIEKLDWINSQYIRKMPIKKLLELCLSYFPKNSDKRTLEKIIKLEQERMNKLSDIGEASGFFFKDLKYDPNLLKWKDMSMADIKSSLNNTYSILCDVKDKGFRADKLKTILMLAAEEFGNGDKGKMLWPLRVALSGRDKSPGPFEIAEILGKKKTLERIKKAIELLK